MKVIQHLTAKQNNFFTKITNVNQSVVQVKIGWLIYISQQMKFIFFACIVFTFYLLFYTTAVYV